MGREQLPAAVNTFIRENYQEAEISFCGKVYTESGAWYRIESELPNKIVLKTLDGNGVLLKEQSILLSTANAPSSSLAPVPTELLPQKPIQLLKSE